MRDGWVTTTIGKVAVDKGLIGGPFGSSLARKDYVETGVPVIRGANLPDWSRYVTGEFVYVSDEKAQSLSRNQAIPGDIVVTQRGTLGQVAIVPPESGPYVISQSQMRLRVDPKQVERDYAYIWIDSPRIRAEINSRRIATANPHINLGIFSSLPITLPPLKEQRRIVDLIDAVDRAGLQYAKIADGARALSNSLRELLAVEAAESVRLGDLLKSIEAGKSPPAEDRQPESWEFGVLKVSAVRQGRFDPMQVKALQSPDGFPPHAQLCAGDLLMTRANTRQLVGAVCIVDTAPANYLLCDKTLRLVPRLDLASEAFLAQALRSVDARRQIEGAATGTSGSMKNISQDSIRALVVPLLERSEQDAWAERISAAERLADAADQTTVALKVVRSSLLSDLLSGTHEFPNRYDTLLESTV